MPNCLEVRVSNLLQQCTFKQLKEIHAIIVTSSLHQNITVLSKFLKRSTEYGRMEYPNLVFSQIDFCFREEIVLWNTMIRGYAYNGPLEKSMSIYEELLQRGLKPHNFTYPYVLKSCGEMDSYRKGKKVHCHIIKSGFELSFSVETSLLNMYLALAALSDKLRDARKIFDAMHDKPLELWNRMIYAYVNIDDVRSAQKMFEDMPRKDIISGNSMLTGYARVGDIENAKKLFEQMPDKNVVSWTSMVGAFASSGDLQSARKLFEEMPQRNVVSWNSMISSYTQNGRFREALDLFFQMQYEGLSFDGFTLVSALSACSHLGALEIGKWIHYLIKDWSCLEIKVGTALIEMYSKCGDVNRAFTIFNKVGKKDVFCWNVVIKSVAIHGRSEDAVKLFHLMAKRGLKPNDYTISSILFACSHGGLVEEGRKIFYSMESDFRITPKLEHFGCLIDLLSRNGRLKDAECIVKEMPYEPDVAIWGALLGGCRLKCDFKLAKEVIERADGLKENESGVYVLLSNMYASVGQWPEALSARGKMEEKEVWKEAGFSAVIL